MTNEDVAKSEHALEILRTRGVGDLATKMGIELIELSAERAVATMPVEGNTQPLGVLHGGAHVVLLRQTFTHIPGVMRSASK